MGHGLVGHRRVFAGEPGVYVATRAALGVVGSGLSLPWWTFARLDRRDHGRLRPLRTRRKNGRSHKRSTKCSAAWRSPGSMTAEQNKGL